MNSDDYRRCLDELDVAGVRKLYAHTHPHLPQPGSDYEALIELHRARTEAKSIALKKRFYSHRWLIENGYPSSLPDHLRPEAERVVSRIVDAVGIMSVLNAPHTQILRGVMSEAVMECYADGNKDPVVVKSVMMERRAKERRKLLG